MKLKKSYPLVVLHSIEINGMDLIFVGYYGHDGNLENWRLEHDNGAEYDETDGDNLIDIIRQHPNIKSIRK